MSWDEYKVKFLVSKGHNEKEVEEKMKNGEELKVDEESERPGPATSPRGGPQPGRGRVWARRRACRVRQVGHRTLPAPQPFTDMPLKPQGQKLGALGYWPSSRARPENTGAFP